MLLVQEALVFGEREKQQKMGQKATSLRSGRSILLTPSHFEKQELFGERRNRLLETFLPNSSPFLCSFSYEHLSFVKTGNCYLKPKYWTIELMYSLKFALGDSDL